MAFPGGLAVGQGIRYIPTDRNILENFLAAFRGNTLSEIVRQRARGNGNSSRGNVDITLGIVILCVSQLSFAICSNVITADGGIFGRYLKGNALLLTGGRIKFPSDGVITCVVGHTFRKLLSFHPSEILGNLIRESQPSRSGLSHRGNLSSNFLNQLGEFGIDLLLVAQVIGIALTGSQAIQSISLIFQAQTNGVNLYAFFFQILGLLGTVPKRPIGVIYYHPILKRPGYAIGNKDDIFFALFIVQIQIALRLCQAGSVVGAAVSFHVKNGLHKALDTFTIRHQLVQAIACFFIEFSPYVRNLFATNGAGKANQS